MSISFLFSTNNFNSLDRGRVLCQNGNVQNSNLSHVCVQWILLQLTIPAEALPGRYVHAFCSSLPLNLAKFLFWNMWCMCRACMHSIWTWQYWQSSTRWRRSKSCTWSTTGLWGGWGRTTPGIGYHPVTTTFCIWCKLPVLGSCTYVFWSEVSHFLVVSQAFSVI